MSDLKSFFDTVNHDRLMEQLRGKVRDRKVLRLICSYLEAGVMLPDGTREATPRGVPQGGPLSPLETVETPRHATTSPDVVGYIKSASQTGEPQPQRVADRKGRWSGRPSPLRSDSGE